MPSYVSVRTPSRALGHAPATVEQLHGTPRRVIVCGPREWTDRQAIKAILGRLATAWPDAVIVHGSASGADSLAGSVAAELGLRVEVYPADWSTCVCGRDCVSQRLHVNRTGQPFCPQAGMHRNRVMASLPGVVLVLACLPRSGWEKRSGTQAMFRHCQSTLGAEAVKVIRQSAPLHVPAPSWEQLHVPFAEKHHTEPTPRTPEPEQAQATTVVNIHTAAHTVYIGRPGKCHDGYFGNPFKRQPDQPEGSTLEKYAQYLTRRLEIDPEFKKRVHALKGQALGCFCHPRPCHGHILARYIDTGIISTAPPLPPPPDPDAAKNDKAPAHTWSPGQPWPVCPQCQAHYNPVTHEHRKVFRTYHCDCPRDPETGRPIHECNLAKPDDVTIKSYRGHVPPKFRWFLQGQLYGATAATPEYQDSQRHDYGGTDGRFDDRAQRDLNQWLSDSAARRERYNGPSNDPDLTRADRIAVWHAL